MLNKKTTIILRVLPIAAIILWIIIYIGSGKKFDIPTIMSVIPENLWGAAVFILFLYAAKSMSVLLPVAALYIVSGIIFSPLIAITLNMTGAFICITIPYWIGYHSGAQYADKLLEKYARFHEFIKRFHKNDFFISYFLRVVNCLPGDLISLYLGAVKVPYYKYISGGMLGMLPAVIATTLIGASINDISSPMFILSVSLTLSLSVLSITIYRILQYKNTKY